MNIKRDQKINEDYKLDYINNEYNQEQTIIELNANDTLIVQINGKTVKTYRAQFSNCHFNLDIQDKGIRKTDEEINLMHNQIEKDIKQIYLQKMNKP